MHDQKQHIALTSVIASGTMTVAKFVVGSMTGSLGILSEAIHSLLDLVSAVMTFFAVRASDKPADAQHHYGHGKIEALSALFAMQLLVLTSGWIIVEAIHRLLESSIQVEATWYAVTLIVLVIAVDISRSSAIMKVATETASQALEADAFHYTSDIFSSAAVLFGLIMVRIGWPKGDAIAALFVAVVVLLVAYQIGKKAILTLIDTAPDGVAEHLAYIAKKFTNVAAIEHIKVRSSGAVIFAELLIRVSRTLTLENVHDLCQQLTKAIKEELPNLEVLVNASPQMLDNEAIGDTVRTVASAYGLAVHDINLCESSGRQYLSFDVEIDEDLSIYKAHEAVTSVEIALAKDLGENVEIVTHINPRCSRIAKGCEPNSDETNFVTNAIGAIALNMPVACGIHNVRTGRSHDGLTISFHCTFDNELLLRDVHSAASQLEQMVREAIPESVKVVIHTEPKDEIHAI